MSLILISLPVGFGRMNAQAAEWELTDEENAKIEAAYAKIFA